MLILRRSVELNIRSLVVARNKQNRGYSSKDYDGSSSDDEKELKKPKKHSKPQPPAGDVKEESAANRLNRLLASMQTDDAYSAANLAKPGEASRRRKEAVKAEAASKNIIQAAKNVASVLGSSEEGKKQTESELLAKLLGHNVGENATAKKGAELKSQEGELNLSDLIVGMKIDRRKQTPQDQSRGEYVRRTLISRKSQQSQQPIDRTQQAARKQSKRQPEAYTGSVNLFGGEPLGIFKQPEVLFDTPDPLQTWAELHKRELKLQVTHPPANYFEKMILWTEQGKVWRFPIDNEQDLQDEIDVDFSEHIFLEQHLEPWCPNRGPIRHFMELVCVGLSKNPFITAKEKKEHILWFRDYFEAKRDILKELMSKEQIGSSATAEMGKQLEA